MKGPNAPLPVIDLFVNEVTPEEWNNIPLPLVRTVENIKDVFVDMKKLFFEHYNDNVQIKKAVNINQATAYHDTMHAKDEMNEGANALEGRTNQHMVDLETRFKLLLAENQQILEGKMREQISQKSEEQTQLLKTWCNSLTQKKVEENSYEQKKWIRSQLKEVKEMFDVAGVIGKADEKAQNPAPKYLNYAEFVHGINDRLRSAQKEID
jgi:hypothetical protein